MLSRARFRYYHTLTFKNRQCKLETLDLPSCDSYLIALRYDVYQLELGCNSCLSYPLPVLSLTGCISSSPGLQNIYLMELQDCNSTSANSSDFRVRAGYFGVYLNSSKTSHVNSQPGSGICAGASKELACYTITGTSAASLTSRFNASGVATFDSGAVEQLLSFTMFLQSRIFIPLLAAAGALFLIGLFFLTLLKRHIKSTPNQNAANRGQTFRRATNLCLWASTAFTLTSTFAIAQTTSALQYTTSSASTASSIRITSGTTLQVLQWLTFAFSITFAVGISSMFQSSTPADGGSTASPKDMYGMPPP